MQTVTRYLLSNLVIGYINGYIGRNSIVYNRRITLHRGASNPVSFTFKNEDQKAQDITSKEFEFNMIDSESKKAVLTKTLTNLNTTQATSLALLSDGSSTGRTAKATITNTNITGSFVVGYHLKFLATPPTLTGPVEITNVNSTNAAGTETILTLSFSEQTIPSDTVDVTAGPKGTASCAITEGDLLPLDAKFYNFAVREIKADGSREVTYADTGYNAAGTLEILDGAYPDAVNSTSISSFTVTTGPLAKTSGSIDAKPGINNNKALHTIAVYTKNFSGAFRVQGAMTSTPENADYFDITLDGEASPTITFSSSSTVTNHNFYGVYSNVRFTWGNDAGNTGIVDKILYRQ